VRSEKLAELLRGAGLSGRSVRDVVVALGGPFRIVVSRPSAAVSPIAGMSPQRTS
jgi:hypothetical protein